MIRGVSRDAERIVKAAVAAHSAARSRGERRAFADRGATMRWRDPEPRAPPRLARWPAPEPRALVRKMRRHRLTSRR